MKFIHFAPALLFTILLSSFNGHQQIQSNADQFTITLKLTGLADGKKVYLLAEREADLENPRIKFRDTIAITVAKNAAAEFSGTVNGNGRRFAITVEGLLQQVVVLLSRNEKVSLTGSTSDWPKIKTAGSTGTRQLVAYRDFLNKILVSQTSAEINASVLKYVTTHPDDLYTSFVLLQNNSLTTTEKAAAFAKLTAVSKNSYYGLKLADAMAGNKLRQPLREGLEIPHVRLRMLNGDTMTIKEIASKNKLTLIDYWGTWCGPCVAEFPYLKGVYSKYKDKGFSILGITKDENVSGWHKAVDNHGINWQHGSDDFDNARDKIFFLRGIPAYALVDQDGKVIAFMANGAGVPSFGPSIYHEGLIKVLEERLR